MLRRFPALLILSACAVAGDAPPPAPADAPPPPPPAASAPTAGQSDRGDRGNRGNRGDGFMQRMIAENPELKGVDPSTPEGQEKIRQAMQARMEKNAPQMRQRMAEQQAQQHAELKKTLGMTDEEFTAVEPLLTRVESLRLQRTLVDPAARPGMGMMGGGRRGGPMGGMDPKLILGDTPMEPTAQEIADAAKALKALVDDQQANANELAAATVRVRKAREAFQAVFAKAQEELRSVLSQRQEAVLVERSTLD